MYGVLGDIKLLTKRWTGVTSKVESSSHGSVRGFHVVCRLSANSRLASNFCKNSGSFISGYAPDSFSQLVKALDGNKSLLWSSINILSRSSKSTVVSHRLISSGLVTPSKVVTIFSTSSSFSLISNALLLPEILPFEAIHFVYFVDDKDWQKTERKLSENVFNKSS